MKIPQQRLFIAAIATTYAMTLIGCDDNNRVPTPAEVKAADVKRQSYVDSLNLPPDVKARMKAQVGGPPAANPVDSARASAGQKGVEKDRQ